MLIQANINNDKWKRVIYYCNGFMSMDIYLQTEN